MKGYIGNFYLNYDDPLYRISIIVILCLVVTKLAAQKNQPPNIIFILTDDQGWTHTSHRPPRSAVRKGEYKLIKYWSKENKYKGTPKVQLFDIANDLSERKDLSKDQPEKTRELAALLYEFINESNSLVEEGMLKVQYAVFQRFWELDSKT
ncbi:MAG: hypothetical protein JXQ96_00885 [Cyclobacteriaceae bacterium]